MFRYALLAAAFGILWVATPPTPPALAAPVPKDLKKKSVSLDGTWEVVEYHSNGNKATSTLITKWVIDGQNLSIERSNPKGGGIILAKPANVTYSLVKPDGGADNALNYTLNYTNLATPTRSMPGVFEVDGDTLKFCWTSAANGERPAECKPAQGNMMYVFKKVDAK